MLPWRAPSTPRLERAAPDVRRGRLGRRQPVPRHRPDSLKNTGKLRCTQIANGFPMRRSYFEKVEDNFKRLTDQEWAGAIKAGNPDDVPWMKDLGTR